MYYDIENEYIKATVSDFGATLIKLIDKNSNTDIVLGFDDEKAYHGDVGFMGSSVGRNANRIGNASFKLDDKEYKLSVNDNRNQLHGGKVGFSHKVWSIKDKTKDKVVFSYFSIDGEEGFPGNLNVEITYKLDGNSLIWSYSGNSDKDTILNMTNHSYFNLGDESIFNHELKIFTDKYSPTDEFSLTLDSVKNVAGTPYDFRNYSVLNSNISKIDNGIDNNYVFENLEDKHMASLKYNNLQLDVFSDLPDMHLYTAGYLSKCVGKDNKTYKKFSGVCLECQYYPNGINYDSYAKPILKKDETMSHYIRYQITTK